MPNKRKEFFSQEKADSLWRFATSILGDEESAKDVVQDVFEKVWTRTLPILNLDAYVTRAVRNACIDLIRSRKEVTDELPEVAGDSVERWDDRELVRMAMSQLSERQRTVVHLKDIEGYSYEEISQVVGVQENQVRTILSRARKTMRDYIENEMNHEK